MDRCLTVEQFAGLLEKMVPYVTKKIREAGCDISQQSGEPIRRRTAAGMIHHALLCAGEEDEESIEAALHLKDLYTCRTCVNHIAQMYVKGIMTEWDDGIFGTEEPITDQEAEKILQRVVNRQLRETPKQTVCGGWKTILWQEAEQMLKEDRKILLVDVRSEEDYEQGHRKGSINVPLSVLYKNPYCVWADRAAILFLYCEKGCQSRIAAQLLAQAGYGNVTVVL